MQTTIKIVSVKALRHECDVGPAPNVWSFRRAKRGQLTVGAEGLYFESWNIPRGEIIEAHWFTARDIPLPLMAILRVRTSAQVFEFSMEPWRVPVRELPFDVERVEFSILSRRAKVFVACALAAAIVGFAIAG